MKIMLIRAGSSVKECENGIPHNRLDVGFRQHYMRSLVYRATRRGGMGTTVDLVRRG